MEKPLLSILFPVLLSALFLILAACENGRTGSETREDPVVTVVGIPAPETAQETSPGEPRQAVTYREAVLIRGNNRVNGISGFGSNSFPALAGEYRLKGMSAAPTGDRDFYVYLTNEALYFPAEWQQHRAGSIPVYQRLSEEGFLAAVQLDDGLKTIWTALFRFPRGLEDSGLNNDTFNQLLGAWIAKFQYFVSLIKDPEGLSLPAVVDF